MKIKTFLWMMSLILINLSCVPFHRLQYFMDTKELNKQIQSNREEKKIALFDNLYIKILSTDDKTAAMLNFSDEMNRYSNGSSLINLSYLVDKKGNITFPFIGEVYVRGLTTSEASIKIGKALSDYVPNTAVIVKFFDSNVTVLGEVQRAGKYGFSQDKISIYEAIALAGGLTRYGNRNKVVLIREENDSIKNHILDLSNAKIIGSEFYYIEPKDIIVVEPIKAISWSFQNMTYSTVLSTITTIIAIIYILK
jgi:polysaccharide biosynthesis/export protein